jgi:transposase InsO family protein
MGSRIRTDEERFRVIKDVEKVAKDKGLTILKACDVVGISNGSYYTWRKKLVQSSSGQEATCASSAATTVIAEPRVIPATKISEADGNKILEIKATFPHMGVKQLRLYLIRNHKMTYSFRQIRQFLEFHHVPKLKTAFPPQPVRRFERDTANEMWQIDIMNFLVGSQSLYLISFLDDYSRFIVSYQVADNQSSNEVLSLLKRAVSFRKPLSILTDRGIQFCSWNGVTAFQLELKALQIDHLLAREQHPETIGKIEAFHKTIQRELLTTTEFSGVDEARERIHDYIMFYNFSRPHMGIDNKAPAERYFKSLRAYNPHSVYYRQVVPYKGNWNGFKRRKPEQAETKQGKGKAEGERPGATGEASRTENRASGGYSGKHRGRQPGTGLGRRR